MFPGCHVAPLLAWLRIAAMPVPEITLDSAALQFWTRRETAVYPAAAQGRHGGRVAKLLEKWSARVGHQATRPLVRIFSSGGLLNCQRAAKVGKLFKQIAQTWASHRMQEWLRKRCAKAWPGSPPYAMLQRLAQLPLRHLGALPRYAVLRWATAEEDDWWFSVRGRQERTAPCCCGCSAAARTYPY